MLQFRFMKEEDLEEANKIYEECFPENGAKERIVTYRDGVLLAISDNHIVGMVTIDYLIDNFSGEKCAYISNVCISPFHQRRGIAYEMMRECEKICRRNGMNAMKLTSNKKRVAAHKLYEKCGFTVYDTSVFKKNI